MQLAPYANPIASADCLPVSLAVCLPTCLVSMKTQGSIGSVAPPRKHATQTGSDILTRQRHISGEASANWIGGTPLSPWSPWQPGRKTARCHCLCCSILVWYLSVYQLFSSSCRIMLMVLAPPPDTITHLRLRSSSRDNIFSVRGGNRLIQLSDSPHCSLLSHESVSLFVALLFCSGNVYLNS